MMIWMQAWRPRVNKAQSKALRGARLPEGAAEWQAVKDSLLLSPDRIRSESSAEAILDELKNLSSQAQTWWENRSQREGTIASLVLLQCSLS